MSSRQSRNQGPSGGNTTRQNEYFVPRDGIDREVISADICRYLGNDALVRPGHYEDPQTGQVIQGYYITAYRNLTTAMIEDLKADSARWDSERRAQTSRNTPGVQYRYSETHQSRQHHGPTEASYQQQDPYARDTGYDGPRYPGTGAPGYTGVGGTYNQQQQGYSATSAGAAYGGYAQPQQSPPPSDPRFAAPQASSVDPAAYAAAQAGGPYVQVGANLHNAAFTSRDQYANPRTTSAAAMPSGYVTAGQSGYPATTQYAYNTQTQTAGGQAAYSQQSIDPFYGRSPATQSTQGYASQGQQYDEPRPARTSATPTNTQSSSSGTSSRRSNAEHDKHRDRRSRH